MAVNCWVVPNAMLGLAGVTAIDTSVVEVMARVADPETLPTAAVIDVVPADNEVARPFEPDALLIDAVAAFDELQAAVVVRI